jgi:hypothetical protein
MPIPSTRSRVRRKDDLWDGKNAALFERDAEIDMDYLSSLLVEQNVVAVPIA